MMASPKKRIAVIGAGVSGLAAIKACIEECLEPVCFERHDQLGGLWYYTDELRPGQVASTYRSVITNQSKEMLAFSDFPLPKETPVFPSRERVHQYIRDYADHFGLHEYVRYNTDVCSIDRAKDYASTGRWEVHYRGGGQGDRQSEVFDGVMVCSGGFGDTYIPEIPGREDFEGRTIHSNVYREPGPFTGRRVIVVGASHTAGEVSCELGRNYCEKVYLSIRNGTNVSPRMTKQGLPICMAAFKRAHLTFLSGVRRRLMEEHRKSRVPDYDWFGLAAQTSGQGVSGMSNDEIQDSITSGQVTVVPEIVRFTKTGVVLSDGSCIEGVDDVIFATGFVISYKMLNESIIFDGSGFLNLYKYILPAGLEQPTLTVVGVLETLIPTTFNTLEMQSRWSARLLSGKMGAPSKQQMVKDIRRRPLIDRHYQVIVGTLYQDELARDIGVLPSIWGLLFRDPKLAYAFYFEPPVGAWYRLQGTGSWGGARSAIFSVWENTFYAMNPRRRNVRKVVGRKTGFLWSAILGMGLVVALYTQRRHFSCKH